MLEIRISSDILISSLQALSGPSAKCRSENLRYHMFRYTSQNLEISVFNTMEKCVVSLSEGSFVHFENEVPFGTYWLVESDKLMRAASMFEKDCTMAINFHEDSVVFSSKQPVFSNRIQCSKVQEYPINTFDNLQEPSSTGKMPASVLVKLLRATKPACGPMTENVLYANISLSVKDGMAKAVATDGVRIAQASEGVNRAKYADFAFVLEKSCADSVAAGKMFTIPDEDVIIEMRENVVLMRSFNVTYMATQVSDAMIDFIPEDYGMVFAKQVGITNESFNRVMKFISSVRSENESSNTETGLCNIKLLENNFMRVDCDANASGQSGHVEVAAEVKFGESERAEKVIAWDSFKAFRSMASFGDDNSVHFFWPSTGCDYMMINCGCLNYYVPCFA